MCIGCALEIYIWLSNKVFCNIHIGDTLNCLNLRCNTPKLLWVVIYVVCYGWFSPDLVVMNICRQRLIKVDRPLWQRSLANENTVVCRQGAIRWRVYQHLLTWCITLSVLQGFELCFIVCCNVSQLVRMHLLVLSQEYCLDIFDGC